MACAIFTLNHLLFNIMKFIIFLLPLFISCNIFAQATGSTNDVITVPDITTIDLNLDSDDITVKETKGSRIIIESHITLESINNTTLLEFLIKSGRYDLENRVDAMSQSLTITRKKNRNVLLVKGQDCKESIRYIILVPSSVKHVNTNTSTASR